ncbi:hypothetical protein [Halorientalis salina]|uniref:hypothetical protein n=1 Tax=Halorientalis salina TaxID=2932266 RepID=UPI00145D880A|nr:hypothetical protein [Halorientalis salina]
MPTCKHCDREFNPAELVSHETDRLRLVHCPACEAPLGSYRKHGQREPSSERR